MQKNIMARVHIGVNRMQTKQKQSYGKKRTSKLTEGSIILTSRLGKDDTDHDGKQRYNLVLYVGNQHKRPDILQ